MPLVSVTLISKFSSLWRPWQGRDAEKIQLEVGKGLLLFLPCFPYSEPLILPTSLKTDAHSLGWKRMFRMSVTQQTWALDGDVYLHVYPQMSLSCMYKGYRDRWTLTIQHCVEGDNLSKALTLGVDLDLITEAKRASCHSDPVSQDISLVLYYSEGDKLTPPLSVHSGDPEKPNNLFNSQWR